MKNDIYNISPNLTAIEAKEQLIEKIDSYIKNNIIIANMAIVDLASKMLKDGDTLLTYG